MAEQLRERRCLVPDLSRRIHVLETAAAADPEEFAGRRDPVGSRFRHHRQRLTFLLPAALAADIHADTLARQRPLDEHRPPVVMTDPPALVTDAIDIQFDRRLRQSPAASSTHAYQPVQALRN
ncbi:hypothetical protein SPICUR_04270 [Spiribacter curvatus]|uniref:Uncharacterized protein n=1 Tax=Spiribacter curvatus TaxID=1335757 RepID=U5T6L0_9GAMM|nr:hypothetical protein SPICUR_04270 [Spiribacter curvatus]